MSWIDDLDKKFKEINGKEEKHDKSNSGIISTDRSDSSRSNNSNSIDKDASHPDNPSRSGSGNLLRRRLSQEIKIQINKEEKEMITSKAALDDYEAICKEAIPAEDKLVKIFRIIIKLLLGIRTNQASAQKGYNIVTAKKEDKKEEVQ